MSKKTVFYSWLSDLPNKTNRGFIERAFGAALKSLNGELVAAEREGNAEFSLDQDTQGVAGTPPIASTILEKIDSCSVFLADMSFTCQSKKRKYPNPNVLIEYGYALNSSGLSRIVTVANTAYFDYSPEDLPFDLRHLRKPIEYQLDGSETPDQKKVVKEQLVKKLCKALRPILNAELGGNTSDSTLRFQSANGELDQVFPFEDGQKITTDPPYHRIVCTRSSNSFSLRVIPPQIMDLSRDRCAELVRSIRLPGIPSSHWAKIKTGAMMFDPEMTTYKSSIHQEKYGSLTVYPGSRRSKGAVSSFRCLDCRVPLDS